MSNILGKLNLAAFKKASVTTLKADFNGIKAGEKVLIIPIAENALFLSVKGAVYFDWIAFPNDKLEGFSHAIKQSFPKEVREKMSEEDKKSQPFFGNIKSLQSASSEQYATVVATEDDLF